MVVTLVFLLVASIMIVSALVAVANRNLVRATMGLVLVLFGNAVLFVLLEAYFLAMAQIIIYIGAIAILIVFAIMLTRHVGEQWGPAWHTGWPWAFGIALGLAGALGFWMIQWPGGTQLPQGTPQADYVQQLGQALVSPQGYVVPFEVASVLLLAALIGAIYVAWGGRRVRGPYPTREDV